MDTSQTPLIKDSLSHLVSQPERGTLRIAELYSSRQGEGVLTGTESVFVRVSGCNLRCWFCDTPHASWNPEGEQLSVDSIVEKINALKVSHIVLTGGEPLLFPATTSLCDVLRQQGLHITIETAGTIVHEMPACDLMSISPKLSGSGPQKQGKWQEQHEQRRWRPDVVRKLVSEAGDYQVKFVIDLPQDQDEVLQMLHDLSPEVEASHVWIMPQARDADELDQHEAWVKPWAELQGFNYCDRKQLRWYGPRRGT